VVRQTPCGRVAGAPRALSAAEKEEEEKEEEEKEEESN
jgi:hypothetical protein